MRTPRTAAAGRLLGERARIAILCVMRWRRPCPIAGSPSARHGRDDRHGPVGRDGQRARRPRARGDLLDGADIGEVDDLAHVGHLSPRRISRWRSTRHDPEPSLACAGTIARPLVRPAPSKRTLCTARMLTRRPVRAARWRRGRSHRDAEGTGRLVSDCAVRHGLVTHASFFSR
jgi:hypothetical protein